MKKIIFGAMAAAALLACSKEQVIEQNRANDEIGFSVVAENQTKAAAVYDSNNKMGAFTVAATYTKDGSTSTSWYFQNDIIAYQDPAWVNTTDTRYWSADGTHNFYAIVNGTMKLDDPTAAPTVVNFKPERTVVSQTDLLYAVQNGQRKSDSPVELNFRHALSQIQFKAKNTNPQLHVKISGVQVGNTPGVGTFTYPTTADAAGTWVVTTPANYTVTFDEVDVAGNNTETNPSVDLTCTNENSMLLLPAETTAWAPTTGGGNNGEGTEGNIPEQGGQMPDIGDDNDGGTEGVGGGGDWGDPDEGGEDGANSGDDGNGGFTRSGNVADVIEGSYLAVKCQIYNVAGTAYANTDVCIYEGWAMIPAAFTWEQGKKYIYTFVFGEGDFGYNGGTGDTPTPTPDREKVLTTMNYTVTVDNFTPVAETEKNMTR